MTKYEYTDKAMELAVSCKTFAENTCQRWRDEVPYGIDAITNGVHAPTWVSEPFQELFDRYIPGWRKDSFMLRYALNISREDVWNAHQRARRLLLDRVNRETNAGMKEDVLTLGFARRATAYKRADLLVHDIGRLKDIAVRAGKFQVVYSGKAHPHDQEGKQLILAGARSVARPCQHCLPRQLRLETR